ncbi:DUF4159 domain-containing protein [Coleofasciculus sp. FACHB-1120]|uniref:DUF4159 domain-containing protein n=1 Tax=Coleofasciculus sp. FACHB-1120 TaxID=2692783 RepID=UPI0016873BA3|nr:DUF4159 domain-containing protein [Coleofasciculus sp. FACHB-1120]MBD2744989.1 DUF4159 domain-containing protein [Coleofasciculus sp. FACHB-1120]
MFPPPPTNPLERLQVTDGLLMNADRWRRAHEYHRQRQNIHYQSLNQPGIVCGLGVRLIAAPAEVAPQFRDGRWVQIQPGIAIDVAGNPIIVSEPIEFRVSGETLTENPQMVYLSISYVDPEKLRRKESREFEKETFRLDEKTTPPSDMEVELCRIFLQSESEELEHPKDVFFPTVNSLDLRYRAIARSRPQAVVRVAQVTQQQPADGRSFSNLSYLLNSVPALYPSLQGADLIGQVPFLGAEKSLPLAALGYDLLYFTGRQALYLNDREFEALKNYLETGGILLVDAATDAIELIESIMAIAQQLGTPLEDIKRLSRNHPLRTQPFLFAALPTLNQQPIQLGYGGGIILVVGSLSAAWGLDDKLLLPRETIRTAQELGINLLHFAWRRRQLTQLLRADNPISTVAKPSVKQAIFDKLQF